MDNIFMLVTNNFPADLLNVTLSTNNPTTMCGNWFPASKWSHEWLWMDVMLPSHCRVLPYCSSAWTARDMYRCYGAFTICLYQHISAMMCGMHINTLPARPSQLSRAIIWQNGDVCSCWSWHANANLQRYLHDVQCQDHELQSNP